MSIWIEDVISFCHLKLIIGVDMLFFKMENVPHCGGQCGLQVLGGKVMDRKP